MDFVETTIPVLMNKAFRNLSKLTNRTKIFRVAQLLAVLSEWFSPILSSENAVRSLLISFTKELLIFANLSHV